MSTWGQLRLVLQMAGPGVSLDLIDSYLNTRYAKVLQATDWQGISAHTTIQTQAAYQSLLDTVTLTVGSTAVAGVGTAWTNAITGQRFYAPGDEAIYTATWVSANSLTLDRPYEGQAEDPPGTVYAGAAYVFMQNVYPLPSDCDSVIEILNPLSGLPLQMMSQAVLDESVGPRALVEDVEIFCVYDDTPETSPPVLHQVEFYPPPRYSRGCVTNYRRHALGFTGQNTSGSPLSFVTDLVLLAGVRADIATHLEKLTPALKYEKEFDSALGDMLRVEHQQRRRAQIIRMAPRFTRHRIARAARGSRSGFTGTEGPS